MAGVMQIACASNHIVAMIQKQEMPASRIGGENVPTIR